MTYFQNFFKICIYFTVKTLYTYSYYQFSVSQTCALTFKKHLKNVGPICHCEPPPHCHSPGVATVAPPLLHAACASMSMTTTTTRNRGDRYGPIEWAQLLKLISVIVIQFIPELKLFYCHVVEVQYRQFFSWCWVPEAWFLWFCSIPTILPASCTFVCSLSFEELIVTDKLLAAVVTPGCSLQTSVKDRFIEHFPQCTQLELLLKQVCWRCSCISRHSTVIVVILIFGFKVFTSQMSVKTSMRHCRLSLL